MSDHEKTAYQEKMEAKLTKLKADLTGLEAQLKEKEADTQIVEQLREKWDFVQSKLQKLRAGSNIAWQETRDGVSNAWSELQKAFDETSERIKNS